jgi:hypothetical protein
MDFAFTRFDSPATGFIAFNLNLTAAGAKFRPLTAIQASTDPAKSAAKIGHMTDIELIIFVLIKFINA